jgi:hypothetical protein
MNCANDTTFRNVTSAVFERHSIGMSYASATCPNDPVRLYVTCLFRKSILNRSPCEPIHLRIDGGTCHCYVICINGTVGILLIR